MKSNLVLAAALLTATNIAFASGGLSIDNVEKHMNADRWTDTEAPALQAVVEGQTIRFEEQDTMVAEDQKYNRPEISVVGPSLQFDYQEKNQERLFADSE